MTLLLLIEQDQLSLACELKPMPTRKMHLQGQWKKVYCEDFKGERVMETKKRHYDYKIR